MNRFRGLNEDGSSVRKLNRDDDQLLALNYENLCDLEYLGRLLAEDGLVEAGVSLEGLKQTRGLSSGSQPNGSPSGSRAQASSRSTTSGGAQQAFMTQGWNLTPDLPEDLIIFGDLPILGGSIHTPHTLLLSLF